MDLINPYDTRSDADFRVIPTVEIDVFLTIIDASHRFFDCLTKGSKTIDHSLK